MNQAITQQVSLDEALVSNNDRVTIRSCNMRIDPTKTQKEATYQVILDTLKLSPFYNVILITTDVREIYMQQFWFTISKIKDTSLYQFKLDNKKFKIGVELFRKILLRCLKVPNAEFVAPPPHDSIVTFIKSLGYKGSLESLCFHHPSLRSPEPTISCINDLDFFKNFENKFPAIVYNDALTSKSDFSTKPTLCPEHIDEFDFKDETSLSKHDEKEQNILYYNDLFPFNIIYPDDLKSDKGNDDNKIDMIQSSRGNENTQGSNKLLKESHDKINKVFIIKSFVTELNVNIVDWNYLVNGMLFNLVKNLYVSFGILFDPKRYYKDGDCARILRRPSQQIRPIRRIESGYKSPTDTPD
ncbi:hypothetical protein Tco_1240469 [Tanacetum coccineum]